MAKSFDDLVRRTTTRTTRARARRRAQVLLTEMLLSEVRKLSGKSQRQLADALGIKQPSLSKLERQADMQISTLDRLVNALGGKLEVVVKFPSRAVTLRQFGSGSRARRKVESQ